MGTQGYKEAFGPGKKFMDTARREMGVTVFLLVQYENVDENGSLAK
jgi:hypothetical protein